jgi:hypothetical protein
VSIQFEPRPITVTPLGIGDPVLEASQEY